MYRAQLSTPTMSPTHRCSFISWRGTIYIRHVSLIKACPYQTNLFYRLLLTSTMFWSGRSFPMATSVATMICWSVVQCCDILLIGRTGTEQRVRQSNVENNISWMRLILEGMKYIRYCCYPKLFVWVVSARQVVNDVCVIIWHKSLWLGFVRCRVTWRCIQIQL